MELEEGWCEVGEDVSGKRGVEVGALVHEQVVEAWGGVGGVCGVGKRGEELGLLVVFTFVRSNDLAVGGVYPVLEVVMEVEGGGGGEAVREYDGRKGMCVWLISWCSGWGKGVGGV